MKLAYTDSMLLTKKERKRSVILAILFGIVILIAIQTIVTIVSSMFTSNDGALDVISLFADALVILSILLFSRYYENRSAASFGLTRKQPFKNIGIGLLVGFVFLLSIFLLNLALGAIETSFNLASISWLFVIASFFGYLFQGTMEETLFRGLIMNSVGAKTSVWVGVIVNSIIFVVLHLGNDSITVIAMLNLFLASLILSFIFYLSDNLLLVGAFHAIWNFLVGPFFGLPVSGDSTYSSVFQTVPVESMEIINGGSFGFEGGFALTAVAVLMLGVLFYFTKKKNDALKSAAE